MGGEEAVNQQDQMNNSGQGFPGGFFQQGGGINLEDILKGFGGGGGNYSFNFGGQ